MKYESTLLLIVIFLFSVFLLPDFETAVQGVSLSEPLRPLLVVTPTIWMLTLILLMAISIVKGIQDE